MKTSTALFRLVHSLDRAERKAFREELRSRSASASEALFDAVLALESWDETELRRRLTGRPMLRQLAVAKHDLRERILRFLGSRLGDTASDLLDDIRIVRALFRKRLVDLAGERARRALAEADRHELYAHSMMLQPLVWQATSLDTADATPWLEQLTAARKHLRVTMDRLDNLSTYNVVLGKEATYLTWQNVNGGNVTAEAERLLEHPLLHPDGPAGDRARLYYHQTSASLLSLVGRTPAATEHLLASLAILTTHPHLADPETTIALTHNLCSAFVRQGAIDRIPPLLASLEDLDQRDHRAGRPSVKVATFETVAAFRSLLAMQGDTDAWHWSRSRIRPGLTSFGERVRERYRYLLVTHLGFAAFVHDDHRLAWTCVGLLLRRYTPADVYDFPLAMRMLELALTIAGGDERLYTAAARRTGRWIANHDQATPAVESIIEALRLAAAVRFGTELGQRRRQRVAALVQAAQAIDPAAITGGEILQRWLAMSRNF